MKTIYNILTAFLIVNSIFFSVIADYPKSKLEKEIDSTGSLLKGEGIIFRPTKVKSDATKSKVDNVNKYLYEATLKLLKSAPIISSDTISGVIVTDWYNYKKNKSTQSKFTILIEGDVIAPEAINIKALQRDKTSNGNWSKGSYEASDLANSLEEEILREARNLYIDSKQK